MNNLEYKLWFNNKTSFFFEVESMSIDNQSNNLSTILSKSFGGTNGRFYTDLKTKILINQKEFDDKPYLIKTPFSDFNWEVTTEQKKIGDYNCYKAVKTFSKETINGDKKVSVTVWFTREIPYPFGPASYLGLPGLVIEVQTENIIIYTSKIILNKKVQQPIKIPNEGKITTIKEYNELTKKGFNQIRKY